MEYEQLLLQMLAKSRKPQNLYEVKTRFMLATGLSDNLADRMLNQLQWAGFIKITEIENPMFLRCIEENQGSRRIKNVKRYCREKYPTKMLIEITESGRIQYLHSVYCLSLRLDGSVETALMNFKDAERSIDYYTQPPVSCDPN